MPALLDDLSDERFKALLRHWLDIRGDKVMPCRVDVDPLQIMPCLAHTWIYRRDEETGNFICDLAGEEVTSVWGKPMIGRPARDFMSPGEYEVVHRRWSLILDTPAISNSIKRMEGRFQIAERLSLPVCDRDGSPTSVVGMALFSYAGKYNAEDSEQSVPLGDARFYDCVTLEPIDLS